MVINDFVSLNNGTEFVLKWISYCININYDILMEYAFLYTAAIVVFATVIVYCYQIMRMSRTVWVNCWFCNKDSTTTSANEDSFVCPFCEQYNGFDETGGYNKVIPAQHASPTLSYRFALSTPASTTSYSSNGLCDLCNFNQSLKVQSLAEYSWSNSIGKEELNQYRNQLEVIYSLCRMCQAYTNQTLGKQDFLLRQKMISAKLMQSNVKLTTAINEEKIYSRNACLLHLNILLSFFITMISIIEFSVMKPSAKFPFKDEVLYSSLSLYFTWAILHFLVPKLRVKIGLFATSGAVSLVFVKYFYLEENNQAFIIAEVLFSLLAILVSLYCYKTSPVYLQSQNEQKFNVSMSEKEKLDTSMLDKNAFENDSNCSTPTSVYTNYDKQEEVSNLDSSLLSLKIGSPKRVDQATTGLFNLQNPFLKCQRNSESFNRNVASYSSKFNRHSINQSSWVAGGYWGSPVKSQRKSNFLQRIQPNEYQRYLSHSPFSHSRSSSQSSGFISFKSDRSTSPSLPKLFSGESVCSSSNSAYFNETKKHTFGSSIEPLKTSLNDVAHTRSFDNLELLSSARSSISQKSFSDVQPIQSNHSMNTNCTNRKMDISVPQLNHDRFSSYIYLLMAFLLGLSISANCFFICSYLKLY